MQKKTVARKKNSKRDDIIRLAELKKAAAESAKAYKDFEAEIAAKMTTKTASVTTDDGTTISVVLVQSERLVIDEARLKTEVGSKIWEKVSTRSLDRKKLDAAIALGDISTTTLGKVSEIHQNNPYLRITEK